MTLDEIIKFGVLGDTQLCSKYERVDLLTEAYKDFQKRKVSFVLHTGDFLDGEKMYRGQEYELHTLGSSSQVEYACKVYPRIDAKTYFITGNHDLSYWKQNKTDVGDLISKKRPDLVYLGQEHADFKIGNKSKIIARLMHPGKGTSYAISYQPQKIVESLAGGKKPNILLIGHFHKAEYLFYRNIHVLQTATLQDQTPFMQRMFISAHRGYWIVECRFDKKGINGFQTELVPFYD